jgi:hypothetical protein
VAASFFLCTWEMVTSATSQRQFRPVIGFCLVLPDHKSADKRVNGEEEKSRPALLSCVYGTLNGRVEFKEPRHGEMKGAMIVITSNTCCV